MPSASVLLPADPVLLLFAAPSSAAARGAAAYPAAEASQAPVGASGVVEVVLERLDGAVPVGRGHCEDDAVVDAAGSAGLLAGLERRFRAASGDVDAEAAFAGVEASSELRLGRALEDDAGADVEVLGFGDVVFRAELADAGHVEGALVDALDAFVESAAVAAGAFLDLSASEELPGVVDAFLDAAGDGLAVVGRFGDEDGVFEVGGLNLGAGVGGGRDGAAGDDGRCLCEPGAFGAPGAPVSEEAGDAVGGVLLEWLVAVVTWSRWFGQLEGLVKVYSDCEITPSSSSAPALTGGCHGWHEAGSYPVIDDDDALWNCGNLAAGAQAWAAALAREISNGLWAPASPPSGFSATVSGRPQAGQVHIAGWDMVLGPLMR